MVTRVGKYYVYIAQCKDGTLYTGYANNLERRIKQHNSGRGAKYTRGRGPVKLVYVKEYKYRRRAMQEEVRIKRLRPYQKEKLVSEFQKNR